MYNASEPDTKLLQLALVRWRQLEREPWEEFGKLVKERLVRPQRVQSRRMVFLQTRVQQLPLVQFEVLLDLEEAREVDELWLDELGRSVRVQTQCVQT